NPDQRRTAFGNKCWSKFLARSIGHVKRAAVRVENARSAFDDEPMQFLRPNGLSEGFAKTVQKIENKRFFDLNFFMRPFQTSNAPYLETSSHNPSSDGRNKQSEKKSRPHHARASLLRRRLVMKVLS